MVILIWDNGETTKIYSLSSSEAEPYLCCHCQSLNVHDIPATIEDRITHLALMIGDNEYHDGENIPSLEDWMKACVEQRNNPSDEKQLRIQSKPKAPWADREIRSNDGWPPTIQTANEVTVLCTGWYI